MSITAFSFTYPYNEARKINGNIAYITVALTPSHIHIRYMCSYVCVEHKIGGGRLDSWMDECAHHMCILRSHICIKYVSIYDLDERTKERMSTQEREKESQCESK